MSTLQLIPPKPKSPLSAYNLYFLLERRRILDGTDCQNLPVTRADLQSVIEEQKNKPKRLHRRSHGRISFRDLSRTVAKRWKQIDEETKMVLEAQAAEERENYEKRLKAWKELSEGTTSGHGAPEEAKPSATSSHHGKAESSNRQIAEAIQRYSREVSHQRGHSLMESLQGLLHTVENNIAQLAAGNHDDNGGPTSLGPGNVLIEDPHAPIPVPPVNLDFGGFFDEADAQILDSLQQNRATSPVPSQTVQDFSPVEHFGFVKETVVEHPTVCGSILCEPMDPIEMDALF